MSRSAYPPITEEDTDVGKLGTAKKGIEDAEMLHPLQIGGRDLVRRRRAEPSMRDWSALLEGFRVRAAPHKVQPTRSPTRPRAGR